MNEGKLDNSQNKQKPEDESRLDKVLIPRNRRSPSRRYALILMGVVLAIGITVTSWWWLRSRASSAGRPVPAPRGLAVGTPGTSPTPANDSTLTLSLESVARVGIKTEKVGEQLATDSNLTQMATGVVRENAYRTTPVVALVGGVLRRVNVELGTNVKRGQPVAVVFSNELAMAQSSYLASLADLDEHHKHHRRAAQLLEIGAVSREEFEQATTKLKTAESEVAAQKQKLLLLGLSQQQIERLQAATQVTSEVSLPAPVSGSVIARSVNSGEVIEANKEIVRIADLSTVWVLGQVYEKDLGRIQMGSGASISTEAYPGRVFRGRVAYIDPTLDSATRTAQVRIELANPNQALKIGMYVSVAFAGASGPESTRLAIPREAVQEINSRRIVFVATKAPNIFEMRAVRLGEEMNGRYQVLEGLDPGEQIVTDGSFLLRAEWLKNYSSSPSP